VRATASIEQAKGVLAWRYALTVDQAGELLILLAGARRLSPVRAARIVVRAAGSATG
jgi:AmiR/NasT family two-component response regulator